MTKPYLTSRQWIRLLPATREARHWTKHWMRSVRTRQGDRARSRRRRTRSGSRHVGKRGDGRGLPRRAQPAARGGRRDSGPFVQREDDTEEAIRNRLNSYHEQTEPLKDYYEEKGILVTVDASKDIDEVTQEVLKAAGEDK